VSTALDLIANARLPSKRAQSLQVVQVAAAFAAQGLSVRLLHARRFPTPSLPPGQDLFRYYGVPIEPAPEVQALRCIDWIDRVPGPLQFVPARLQEWSFSRSAARAVLAGRADGAVASLVLSREIECAARLVEAGHPGVFLELHRVPGGRWRRALLARALRGVAGVVAISGGVARDLEPFGLAAERLVVEHDGVELAPYSSGKPQAAARAAIAVPADVPLAVYAGSLLPWKGVEVLIEAARRLPGVRFVVAGGSDSDLARLRPQAAGLGNLRMDGFQPPERVADYVIAADLFVVPNRSKPAISALYTSPLKVFEAMAAGVPIVASDLPSLRDILTPGEEASFVAPDDPEALARGIADLLANPHARMQMGKRLRIRAPRHSWQRRAQRLVAWMSARAGGAHAEGSSPAEIRP
jgi:glycosyltransferase involved in cell wall biosynthesis